MPEAGPVKQRLRRQTGNPTRKAHSEQREKGGEGNNEEKRRSGKN